MNDLQKFSRVDGWVIRREHDDVIDTFMNTFSISKPNSIFKWTEWRGDKWAYWYRQRYRCKKVCVYVEEIV